MPRAAPNKTKLTPLAVTKLRPQSRPYLVWDNFQRGLVLQVQPSGYRAFKVIYRFNRPRWFHVGAADAIALADARKLAAEIMLEVIRGKDPATERRAARETHTFGTLASRYLEEHAKKRNKSWRQADILVRRYLLPVWGQLEHQRYNEDGRPRRPWQNQRACLGQSGLGVGIGHFHMGRSPRNPDE